MSRFFKLATALLAMLAVVGCSSPPSNLDLSLSRSTLEHQLKVTLSPPEAPLVINQLHAWRIQLASAQGLPIRHARIRVDGGMPQHGHGLPTRPLVTEESQPGVYLLDGMKFSMTGWWEIKLVIDSPAGVDHVTFNAVLTDSGLTR
ncbi:MAG TPA: FixH family protein [Aquabacterium sp.]|nr:FixH family protein [Aquabacterium sp.]